MVLSINYNDEQPQPTTKPRHDIINDEKQIFENTKTGVMGLIESGVEKVPGIFINEQYILEKNNSDRVTFESPVNFPVIDLSGLNDGPTARSEIVSRIKEACRTWGFFQIVNHNMSESFMSKVLGGVQAFHESDSELKKNYYSHDFKKVSYNGLFHVNQAASANWRDTLYMFLAPNPPDPEEFPQVCREIMLEYSKQATELGLSLYEILSEALGLNPNHLKDMGCAKGMNMLAHYYPPCPEPDLTLGLTSHTDSGFLTILLRDQIKGLQVLKDNNWVDVPFVPGGLIINIGDLMELITNGKFKSVHHRVLANKVGPRVSIAFFFRMHMQDSGGYKVYGPMKELLSQENPPIFRDVRGEEIIAIRSKGIEGVPLLSHFKLNAMKVIDPY